MNYMDFHCHLDFIDYNGKRQDIVNQCFDAGFTRIVTVADPYEDGSFERTIETLACDTRVVCMAASHPHNADQYNPTIEKNIIQFIEKTNAVGFGEAGLDYHYNLSTPENQRKVFTRQIELAKDLKLPLIIHSRKAEPDVLELLEKARFHHPVVFHCYTGSMEDAEEIIKRGFYISISGIVTFKNTQFLRDIAKMIPLDRIFTETDSPYLAPMPNRGKTNTPLWVTYVAEKIAEVKAISVAELNRCVNENYLRVTDSKRQKV